MKKQAFIFLAILSFTSVSLFAQTLQEQAKALPRPADCGVADYDAFKNSSFTLKDDVVKTDKNYEEVTTDIAKYSTSEKPVTVANVKSDISRVKSVKSSLQTFDDKVVKLTDDGKSLTENVTKVKPVTKIKPATSNTKDSVKAVDLSRDMLKELGTKVDADLETLNGLLSKAEE
ncbi:MAG: hypothetical protein H6539_02015 [Bacteroidales bacterium]|nr:hypothetical protein [Bacteroidales bacterium]